MPMSVFILNCVLDKIAKEERFCTKMFKCLDCGAEFEEAKRIN